MLVSAMHITAAVYVNDWEDGLIHDFQVWLEKLAPSGLDYRHHQTGEDNADAHLKRTLMGHQVILPITNGQARSRAVGAGVLRRVRRPAQEARRREGHGRVSERARAYPDRPFVGVGAVIVDEAARVLLVKRALRAAGGAVEPARRRRGRGRDAGGLRDPRDARGDRPRRGGWPGDRGLRPHHPRRRGPGAVSLRARGLCVPAGGRDAGGGVRRGRRGLGPGGGARAPSVSPTRRPT